MTSYDINYVAKRIQHTNVNPDATLNDIKRLVEEALTYGFNAVVVNPIWSSYARKLLEGTGVKLVVAFNYPHGGDSIFSRLSEIKNLLADDVDEIDFMINVGYLKSGLIKEFKREMELMVEYSGNMVTKAILETNILTRKEIEIAARISEEAGIDYVKNSSGWGKGGPATPEIIRLLRSLVSERVGVKASGGIRNFERAVQLLEAGADLLGTSRGVQIIESYYKEDKQEAQDVRY